MSLFSARNMCSYEPRKNSKIGRKPKIAKKMDMRIKRAIANIHQAGKKVNLRKNIEETDANASIRTAQRHLLRMDLKYKRASSVIILSKLHKVKRMATITKWIEDQHCLKLTAFSNEKRFSLDGPDDWRSDI